MRVGALRILPHDQVCFERILIADNELRVLGQGFNSKTLRVSINGTEYYVFAQDLNALKSFNSSEWNRRVSVR
jgi:hypothetical protein